MRKWSTPVLSLHKMHAEQRMEENPPRNEWCRLRTQSLSNPTSTLISHSDVTPSTYRAFVNSITSVTMNQISPKYFYPLTQMHTFSERIITICCLLCAAHGPSPRCSRKTNCITMKVHWINWSIFECATVELFSVCAPNPPSRASRTLKCSIWWPFWMVSWAEAGQPTLVRTILICLSLAMAIHVPNYWFPSADANSVITCYMSWSCGHPVISLMRALFVFCFCSLFFRYSHIVWHSPRTLLLFCWCWWWWSACFFISYSYKSCQSHRIA